MKVRLLADIRDERSWRGWNIVARSRHTEACNRVRLILVSF